MTSLRDLSQELRVPMAPMIRTLSERGRMKTAMSELTDEEIEFLRNTLPPLADGSARDVPPPDGRPGDAGAREPRKPRPPHPSTHSAVASADD